MNRKIDALAEELFNAYNEEGPNPWQAHDGREVPRWNEIAPEKRGQIHAKWRAAARKAVSSLTEEARISFVRHAEVAAIDARDGIREAYGVAGPPAITYSGDTG